jgi:hypothetical protein
VQAGRFSTVLPVRWRRKGGKLYREYSRDAGVDFVV